MSNKTGAMNSATSVSSSSLVPKYLTHWWPCVACCVSGEPPQLSYLESIPSFSLKYHMISHLTLTQDSMPALATSRCCEWRCGFVDCVVVSGMDYCMSPTGSSELPVLQMTALSWKAVDFRWTQVEEMGQWRKAPGYFYQIFTYSQEKINEPTRCGPEFSYFLWVNNAFSYTFILASSSFHPACFVAVWSTLLYERYIVKSTHFSSQNGSCLKQSDQQLLTLEQILHIF